jgi:hypothetical protein
MIASGLADKSGTAAHSKRPKITAASSVSEVVGSIDRID